MKLMKSIDFPETTTAVCAVEKAAARALILNDFEYAQTAFAKDPIADTYQYEITQGDKKLVFVGSLHTNKLEHPVFEQIQNIFNQTHPDMVYVEGYTNLAARHETVRIRLQNKTVDEVKVEGESHFTLKLAVEADVDFDSPEPPFSEEVASLVSAGYTKSDIYRFYQYRIVVQYQREQRDQNKEVSDAGCRSYLTPFLKLFQEESGWSDVDLHTFETQLFSELEITNTQKYTDLVTPVPVEGQYTSILNEISSRSSDYRDAHIFDQLADGLKKYDSLFNVYGSAHAVRLEPALRALMQNGQKNVQ